MKKTFLISFLIIFLLNILDLQSKNNFNGTFGFVYDEKSIPLENVSVYLSDQKLILFTDKEGFFSSEISIPNFSEIQVSMMGYESVVVQYNASSDNKIYLKKLHVSLDEIGVVESINYLGNNKTTSIETKNLDFITSNSMLDNLAELTGVDMISSGLGIQKVVVRGLSGMRVVTYLNGMRINNQQWANDHGIGFTNLGLDKVELIKGASALKYGSEAIGGLVYFKDMPFINSDKIKGFVATKFDNSSYLTSNQFGINFGKNNFYFNMYGQYAQSSDYRLPNGDYLFNSRFSQNALKFSMMYKHSYFQHIFRYQLHNEKPGIPGHFHGDPSDVSLNELTSSPSLSDVFTNGYRLLIPYQIVKNQLFTYETSYSNSLMKISLYIGHFINNLKEHDKWTRPEFDLFLTNTQFNPNIRYRLNNYTFNIGSQINIQENKNDEEQRLIPDADYFNLGSYAIVDYFKNNYGFNFGLRHDYKLLESSDNFINLNYSNSYNNISFSSGAFLEVNNQIFRLTFSEAYRAPDLSELFSDGVHHGTNRYEIGNSSLNIERSKQFDLKYQFSNNHLGIVINPFIQYITDFISIEPDGSYIDGFSVYRYRQYEKVKIEGLEVNLHYHPHYLHNLHIEQSYSFLNAINDEDQYGLAMLPANSIKTKIIYNLRDFLSINGLNIDKISLFNIYKFKQDIFSEFENETDSYNVINLLIHGDFNKYGKKSSNTIKFSLGINNLLNHEYTPHISRLRSVGSGIPNPGRSYTFNLKYEF